MRNVGEVLNGRGEPLFPVVKWAKFTFDGLREDIVPGDEIPVLVGDDSLTTFAICRDFLQETGDIPYKKLNVDLAIVPSMTSDNDELDTLVGHAATANTLRVFDLALVTLPAPGIRCRIYEAVTPRGWGSHHMTYIDFFASGAFGQVRAGGFSTGSISLGVHYRIARMGDIYTNPGSLRLGTVRFVEALDNAHL